jgi:rsbT co-antagonist protein RsbR
VRCEARRGPDGAVHGTILLIPPEDIMATIERVLLRTLMDTIEIVLWTVKADGTFIYHDGKALASAGLTPGQLLGQNIFELYPAELVEPIRAATKGTPSRYTSEVHGDHWETWNIPMKNAAGEPNGCIGLTLDVSETTRTEQELKRQLETIQQQQNAIQELSTPLIEVWDRVLTVPLVGIIDSQRANALIERLLSEVSRSGARFAILALTGVEALDTSTASHILRLLGSLRLLGADGRTQTRYQHPATRIIINPSGTRAITAIERGESWSLHRIDLVTGKSEPWCDAGDEEQVHVLFEYTRIIIARK